MADIDSLSIRINADTGSAVAALDRLAATLAKINSISSKAGGAAGSTSSSMSRVGSAATKLNGILSKTGRAFSSTFNALTFIPRKVATPFIRAVGKMGSAVLGLGRQLARVAMYRALRSAIKLITSAFSEGIENLYKWSHAFDRTFYNAMNTIATAKTYFSNSFAAMASPLIEAFAPAIDTIIDKFVEMFNIANQFFSRLVGKDTYTVARKVQTVWDDVDEDVDNTNTKIKELRKTLLGFDEINRLDKATSETSTGGSNSKPPDTTYMWMFEQRPINDAVASFADMLKEAFQKADWEGIGKLLGNALNGLLDKIDFAGLGTKLGNAITAMFTTAYWFLVTFDFTKLGEGIATLLNNAINSIDFEIVGRTLVRWFTGGVDALIGFLTTFDFGRLATQLSNFCIGVFNEIYDWFDSYENWADVGRTIGDNIAAAILNIRYGEIWQTLCQAVDKAVESIIELVTGAVSGLTDKFKEAMNWEELPESIQNTVTAIAAIGAVLTFAAGAALAFSGYNIPLGLTLMATSGVLGMVSISLKWDLVDMVQEHIGAIKFAIGSMGFAVGAALAFSGINIPLGMTLMIMSGALGATNAKEAWDSIENAVDRAMFAAETLAGTFQLTLGILALITKNYGAGFALVLAGIATLGHGVFTGYDFGKIGNIFRQILPPVEALIGGFELTLGILAFIARKYAIGFALILGGIASLGVAAYSGFNFDGPKNALSNTLSKCEMALGGFLLSLGLIAIIAHQWPIGIGLVLGGIETLGIGAAQYDWNSLRDKFKEVMGNTKVVLLQGASLAVIGGLLCLIGATPLGIGILVAGLVELGYGATQVDWGALGKKIQDKFNAMKDSLFSTENIAVNAVLGLMFCLIGLVPFAIGTLTFALIGLGYKATQVDWGSLYDKIVAHVGDIVNWLKTNGKLALGILAMVGSGIGTGINAVVDGVKELWKQGTVKWNSLVELGKTAINKISEGWEQGKDLVIDITVKIAGKLWDGVKGFWDWLWDPNAASGSPTWTVDPLQLDESSIPSLAPKTNTKGATKNYNSVSKAASKSAKSATANITVNALPGTGFKTESGGRNWQLTTTEKLKSDLTVDAKPKWQTTVGSLLTGFLTFLGILKPKTTVAVDTSTAWAKQHKSFIDYLGINNKTVDVNVNAKRGNFKNGLGAWIGYSTHNVTVNLVRGNWYWGLSEWIGQEVWVRVNLYAGGGVVNSNGYTAGFAGGGIITRSGWNHLDKAANGGTKPHGTMFVAGEAGPEIVGHIGGRTEILNKSQLASTMFASVSAAIAPAVKVFTSMGTMFAQAANEAMNASIYTIDRTYAKIDAFAGNTAMMDSTTAENMSEMLELMRANAEATMEQNRLLQQQNDYLRQINDKEFSAEVSTAAINKAQLRSNRRAGVTVVSVGAQ